MKKVFLPLLLCFAAIRGFAADDGYLFVTFKDERTPMAEQGYFCLSKDGLDWEALNKDAPVLVTTIGAQGARDLAIIRSRDGKKTYVLATDLSIYRTPSYGRAATAGSKSIVIWESDDLVKWSEPRLVRVAAEDAGCAWTPEAIYDEETHDYLVIWASKNKRDNFAKHRIWAARTTDFKTFGEPFIYIDKPYGVIEPTIIREYGTYYRFSKNDRTGELLMESCPTLTGEWREMPESSMAKVRGTGPSLFLLKPTVPPTWALLLDTGRGYQTFVTEDAGSGQFTPVNSKFPYHVRPGAVLPITPEEYERLKKAFP